MATGTGNLPYPGKVYNPFDVLTAEELNEDVANIESLADGSGIGDGAITSERWRNGVAFQAYRSAALSVTSSFVNVAPDTERYDIGSNFAGGQFTAPHNGIYHFDGTINLGASSTARGFALLYVNNTEFCRGYDSEATRIRQANISADTYLTAGQTVQLYGFSATSVNVASTGTIFSGHLVTRHTE